MKNCKNEMVNGNDLKNCATEINRNDLVENVNSLLNNKSIKVTSKMLVYNTDVNNEHLGCSCNHTQIIKKYDSVELSDFNAFVSQWGYLADSGKYNLKCRLENVVAENCGISSYIMTLKTNVGGDVVYKQEAILSITWTKNKEA